MKKIAATVGIVVILFSLHGLTVETASLSEFLYGSTEDTAYDNWMSHIVEGLASPGYNQYAPWDRQTNDFGNFVRASSGQLSQWGQVVSHFLDGQYEEAEQIIEENEFPYEIVQFNDTDTDRTYYMLREFLNMEFFDDNGEPDRPEIHQHGSFDYGWGLYIFNPDSEIPIVITTPHPKDDFITVPVSCMAFQEWDARYLMISGAGREAMWTGAAPYTNGKSLSDPTRNDNHPFNTAYRAFCDEIRETFDRHEFSVQIHSFDYTHTGFNSLQIALGSVQNRARYPGLPIRDLSGRYRDIINASPYIIHPANRFGVHDEVLVTDYYSVYYNVHGLYYNHEELGQLRISNRINLTGIAGPQYDYTIGERVWNTFDVYSPFFHIELEELPSIFPQTMPYYHRFYGFDLVEQRWRPEEFFTQPLAYYKPWITALNEVLPDLFEFDDGTPPTNPSNLRITSDTGTRVGLTWDRSYDFDFKTYEVLVAQAPFDFEEPNYSVYTRTNLDRLAAQAHTTITFTSLNAERDYYFTVRAKDYNGNYSDYSNVATRILGSARVSALTCVGRDGYVELSWTANWQNNNLGFKVWRSEAGADDYAVISSYEENEFLAGNEINNYPYSFVDYDVQYHQRYDYLISYVDVDENEYFINNPVSASSHPFYTLYFSNADSTIVDSLQFGVNHYADDTFDETFDIRKPSQPGGDFIYAMTFYRLPMGFIRSLQRDITYYFNPEETYFTWSVRARTNLTDEPISISISDNYFRNSEKLYIGCHTSGTYFNLAEEAAIFSVENTDYRYFTLLWGNMLPVIEIQEMSNRFATAGDSLSFQWEIPEHKYLIDSLEVYLTNGTERYIIETFNESPIPDYVIWEVPDSLDIFNAHLCIKAILADEYEVIERSSFRINFVAPEQTFTAERGSYLFSNPYTDTQLERETVFGEFSELFFFDADSYDYIAADSSIFGKGYWLNLPEEYEYHLRGRIIDSTYTVELSSGWNLVPNVLFADITVQDLVFRYHNQNFSYYEAVILNLVENNIYEIKDSIYSPTGFIPKTTSFLIYSRLDNIYIDFVPFHRGPERLKTPTDWEIAVRAELGGNQADEVIIGFSKATTDAYNLFYDLPKPPRRPNTGLHIYLNSDIDSHPFPNMHQEYKHPLADDEDSRYWDLVVETGDDTEDPVIFSIKPEHLPEKHLVELIIGDDVYDLTGGEGQLYYPENDIFMGHIRVKKEPPTSIDDDSRPAVSILYSNFPNPFNPETTIKFSIKEETDATLSIYNIKGQLVKTLHNGLIKAGEHRLIWDGKNNSGRDVSSGVYFYRLKTDDYEQVNKMLLVK